MIEYEDLLAELRKDLQIDPSIDCVPPGLVSAQGAPWKIDSGTQALTFSGSGLSNTVTVAHRIGRIPIVTVGTEGGGVWVTVSNKTATTFQVQASFSSALTQTVTVDWVALG